MRGFFTLLHEWMTTWGKVRRTERQMCWCLNYGNFHNRRKIVKFTQDAIALLTELGVGAVSSLKLTTGFYKFLKSD